MKIKTLQKANELSKLISEYESALNCFEYDYNSYLNDIQEREGFDLLTPDIKTTNPKLIIEHDDIEEFDGGRVRQPIPMVLSDFLIDIIKKQIRDNLEKLKKEFEEL